jgi:hypothetical protein
MWVWKVAVDNIYITTPLRCQSYVALYDLCNINVEGRERKA